MPINFSNLRNKIEKEIYNPRDIFLTLNKNIKFSFPRDIQTEVLNQWYDRRDEKDIIIKLNVGSGKTLIGLLILQSSLNEKKGPALYVAPNIQLQQQIISEAKDLGLKVTDDPNSYAYISGESICVINIYKIFNGLSVFGVNRNNINIGTIIIDDAHACINTVSDQTKILIDNQSDAYKAIFNILSEDIRGYTPSKFLELEAGDPQCTLEVPFWSWSNNQSKLLEALHFYKDDEKIKFSYPFLKDILCLCRCVINGQFIEIQPYFPPTDLITSFRRANRRVYMTATLSDDSVIITHFGAQKENLKLPIIPTSSQSMGERMILMPQTLKTDLNLHEFKSILCWLAKHVNVVVIVPSQNATKEWDGVANQILLGENIQDGIERMKNGHVGLTILVNRYDGIDLPGNACRVLAIMDLPETNSYIDMIDDQVLNNSAMNLRKNIERIEQGMGRGVRSNDDYCVVLLFGSKLISRIRLNDAQKILTPETKAQLNITKFISDNLHNPSLNEIVEVILQCINRDPDWIKLNKEELLNLPKNSELNFDDSKIALKNAFDYARKNQYEKAILTLNEVIDKANDDAVKGWLLARRASFEHHVDAITAQNTLRAAHSLEPSIMKPMSGIAYKKIKNPNIEQANSLINNHQRKFQDAIQMRLFVDSLCSDLVFVAKSEGKPQLSKVFEKAVDELAYFLGINSQRPDREYNVGPDNLWVFDSNKFFIIECKNEVKSDAIISKHNVGQLSQSVDWFKKNYGNKVNYKSILIAPQNIFDKSAVPIENMCIINSEKISLLHDNLKLFAEQISDLNVAKNTQKIAEKISYFNFNDNFDEIYTVKPNIKTK